LTNSHLAFSRSSTKQRIRS